MKKLSIMLVSALFAYQATAVAQTVKKTDKKTKNKTVTITTPPNTQEYSTAHKGPIESYKSIDSTQQGASALNRVEGDTANVAVKTTVTTGTTQPANTPTKKNGSKTKVRP
jgi:hypothetical protein